ncbi:MAG: amino acid ABC transporter permease [Acutalibacteraceae bacterium]|jgi:His/Glu/Gln/Arg/opine family amino acid ABC transporter permease subunit
MAVWESIQNVINGFSDAVFLALIKEDRYRLLLQGLGRSLLLTVLAAVLGVTLGLLLAVAKLQNVNALTGNRVTVWLKKLLVGFANGYIAVIRGTPAVVQLMVIYFILFGRLLRGLPLPDYIIASIAFGINSGAYVAEIIRAGILAVDRGQTEAGRSLGLSGGATMTHIVIPQAIKNVLPALGNEFIVLLKETSIAGYIGIADLTKGAQSIGSAIYDYIVPLLCAAFIYFLMTTGLSTILNKLEGRMRRGD